MDDATVSFAPVLTPSANSLQMKEAKEIKTGKDFEAVFLTQFVDEMMKTAGPTAFGGKQQADMWRSFMSEAIAKNLVEQGGFGLAGNVSDMLSAYGKPPPASAAKNEANVS